MPTKTPDRILRLPEVKDITGLSRSTIYKKISEKTFPDRIDLGGRAIGWRSGAIMAWLNNLPIKNTEISINTTPISISDKPKIAIRKDSNPVKRLRRGE